LGHRNKFSATRHQYEMQLRPAVLDRSAVWPTVTGRNVFERELLHAKIGFRQLALSYSVAS